MPCAAGLFCRWWSAEDGVALLGQWLIALNLIQESQDDLGMLILRGSVLERGV